MDSGDIKGNATTFCPPDIRVTFYFVFRTKGGGDVCVVLGISTCARVEVEHLLITNKKELFDYRSRLVVLNEHHACVGSSVRSAITRATQARKLVPQATEGEHLQLHRRGTPPRGQHATRRRARCWRKHRRMGVPLCLREPVALGPRGRPVSHEHTAAAVCRPHSKRAQGEARSLCGGWVQYHRPGQRAWTTANYRLRA